MEVFPSRSLSGEWPPGLEMFPTIADRFSRMQLEEENRIMDGKTAQTSAERHPFDALPFFAMGFGASEALSATQKVLLEGYEESVRAWLGRMQSEAALWSELPAKMAVSGSVANALGVYTDCVSRQMQMSVEDGQQLLDECRRLARRVADSLGGDRRDSPTGPELPLCL